MLASGAHVRAKIIMDYELAKQLKDAGFQKEVYAIGDRFYEFDVQTNEPFLQWVSEWYLRSDNFEHLKTKLFIHTLDELIEACGLNVQDFNLRRRFVGSSIWIAELIKDGQTVEAEGRGSTSTEAVARLWLALHANGDTTA